MSDTKNKSTSQPVSKIQDDKNTTHSIVKKSNFKNKLFGLILVLVLVIPAVIWYTPPQLRDTTVLGVIEDVTATDTTNANYSDDSTYPYRSIVASDSDKNNINRLTGTKQKNNEAPMFSLPTIFNEEPNKNIPKESDLGEIGSGAQDIRLVREDSTLESEFKGLIVADTNTKVSAATDKFPVGTSINVRYGNKNIPLVVAENRIMPTDTVLVVNKETFSKFEASGDKIEVIIDKE